MKKINKHFFNMIATAVLSALSIVLSRFLSVNLWNMSIGFAFIPILICGMLCGPFWSGVCGAVADLVGALLFPFGVYFPGFTAVAFLNGVIYGFVGITSNKCKKTLSFSLISLGLVTFSELLCSLTLNSLWINLLYGAGYIATLVSRIPVSIATVIITAIILVPLRKAVVPSLKKIQNK